MSAVLTTLRAAVRSGAWVDSRWRAYANIILTIELFTGLLMIVTAHGSLDRWGRPIGTDFVSYYAAATLSADGVADAAYDPVRHHAAETAAAGGPIEYYAFFYPPVFLLVLLPLAALPFRWALIAWLTVTGGAWLAAMRTLLPPHHWRLATLAFPALWLTAGHGQATFLSAAIMVGGLALRRDRPVAAGTLLGCLAFKPQHALGLAIVLLAAGQWRVIAGTLLSGGVLIALSWAVFGAAAWVAFFHALPLAQQTLEDGLLGFGKFQSVFAALRLWGVGSPMAYLIHGLTVATAAVITIRLWLRPNVPPALKNAAVVVLGLIAPPFMLDYDLLLLGLPLAMLLTAALRSGFLPWEKSVLAGIWLLPMVVRLLATNGLPLTPFALLLLLGIIDRRARQDLPARQFM